MSPAQVTLKSGTRQSPGLTPGLSGFQAHDFPTLLLRASHSDSISFSAKASQTTKLCPSQVGPYIMAPESLLLEVGGSVPWFSSASGGQN